MRKLFFINFLILIMFCSSSFAIELIGEGFGANEKEAKDEAMADLSAGIYANVSSSFEKIIKTNPSNDVKQHAKKVLQIKSDLPIIGADFNSSKKGMGYDVKAILRPEQVLKQYTEKLNQIMKEKNKLVVLIGKEDKKSEKHRMLLRLLTLVDSYYKHKTVAVALGGGKIKDIGITEAEIRNKLSKLEGQVNSIKFAAKLFAKKLSFKNVYVYPVTTSDSSEVTQFASVLKDYMDSNVNGLTSPNNAKYFLYGTYNIEKDGITVTYRAMDRNHVAKATMVKKLSPQAYENLEYKPVTTSFEKILQTGLVVSSDFRVGVKTIRGKRNLLFKKGEEVELFVKLNRPGYLYIVGHVKKPKEKVSYIIDLGNGDGKRKFVMFLGGEEVNKWTSLGKFEATAPFGVESLQVIASNEDIVDKIPSYDYDDSTGLYIISKNPEDGVIKTRALIKKKTKKRLFSEDTLIFTTLNSK